MEKTSITVSMEKERFEALMFYLQRKEQTTAPKLMEKMLMELYEKYVPQDTREYIDSRLKPAPLSKAKPKKKDVLPTNMNSNGAKPAAGQRTQAADEAAEAPV